MTTNLVSLEEAEKLRHGFVPEERGVDDEVVRWWERVGKPTPGPWQMESDHCDCGGDYPCGHDPWAHELTIGTERIDLEPGASVADGHLLAMAPRLLATVIELGQALGRIESLLDDANVADAGREPADLVVRVKWLVELWKEALTEQAAIP